MRVAVIGGRLQGLEAVYLAKKAGWQVLLFDKRDDAPAVNIADRFYCFDVSQRDELAAVLNGVDLIIPALENRKILQDVAETAARLNIPFAFHFQSYDISASKSASNLLFAEIGVPAPRPWPDCRFPLIAKPEGASGSEGVTLLQDERDFRLFREKIGINLSRWVIQEYLEGPSYSIEIMGCRGKYLPLQVTALEMDSTFDCKRVLAPSNLAVVHQKQFADIARQIARRINLNGIMDVEVILHDNQLQVLEIDARLPSQTPTAVYQSTGINMLELLAACFMDGLPASLSWSEKKFVIFEHIVVSPGRLEVTGEHAVAAAGPLTYFEDFFGATEALTNYRPGKENWTATLIFTGNSRHEVAQKRSRAINNIIKEMGIECYVDPDPQGSDYTGRKELDL